MPYDKQKHRRRSIRLPGYDYTSTGAYFVTICVHGWECLLGEVVDAVMRPSEFGQVVSRYWMRIPVHVAHVELDEWVVMPNHIHGIIMITGRGEASPEGVSSADRLTPGEGRLREQDVGRDASPLLRSGSLGAIVGNFKSVTTRRVNRMRGTPGVPFWQRNYWEHIIRNDQSLHRIRAYIRDNPARWDADRLHPATATGRHARIAPAKP